MAALAKTSPVPTGPQLDNRRVAAALIDLVIPLAGVAAAYAAGLSLTGGLLLVGVGWTLYYFFALESGDGQTLGKRAMKLRVVSADGTPATMKQIAKRTVVRIVDGHIVGLIVMLATGERRLRLGDIVAGTVVTDAQSASSAPGATTAPPAVVPAPSPVAKRKRSLPSLGKSSKPKPAAASPAVAAPTPPAAAPSAKRSLFKRDLSLPSADRRSPSPLCRLPPLPLRAPRSRPCSSAICPSPPSAARRSRRQRRPRSARRLRSPRPPHRRPDKPSLLKRELSLPSFGRKARRRAADSPGLTQTASPGPGATPAPSVPAPDSDAPVEPPQSDRLTDALRAGAPPEVTPFDPFEQPDVAGSEPSVEFDGPEPSVEFEQPDPDPLADLGGREPVVEMDEPEPSPSRSPSRSWSWSRSRQTPNRARVAFRGGRGDDDQADRDRVGHRSRDAGRRGAASRRRLNRFSPTASRPSYNRRPVRSRRRGPSHPHAFLREHPSSRCESPSWAPVRPASTPPATSSSSRTSRCRWTCTTGSRRRSGWCAPAWRPTTPRSSR